MKYKLTVVLGTLLSVGVASAEIAADQYSLGLGGSGVVFAQSRHVQNSGGWNLSGQYWLTTHWSANVMMSQFATHSKYTPNPGVNVGLYTIGMNYAFIATPTFYPYLAGGTGLWHFSRVMAQEPKTQAALYAGGGMMYFLEPALAFDLGLSEVFDPTVGKGDPVAYADVRFFFGTKKSS